MNDDTISRQAAIDVIFSEPLYESGMKKRDADAVVPAIYEKIKSLPPAERRGRWIYDIDDQGWSWAAPFKCNQCGKWNNRATAYCPHCGSFNGEGINDCSTCPTAQNTNLEDDDSPCRDCEVE